MGAWSESVFGNDDAADYLCEIESAGSTTAVAAVLEEGLDAVAGEDGYVYAPEGAIGLAAAALTVAWRKPELLNEDAAGSVGSPWPRDSASLPPELEAKAAVVFDRMRNVEGNELAELWAEAGRLAEFEVEIDRWRTGLSWALFRPWNRPRRYSLSGSPTGRSAGQSTSSS